MFLLTALCSCRAANRKLCWLWTSCVTLWTATKHFVRDATEVTGSLYPAVLHHIETVQMLGRLLLLQPAVCQL